MAAEVEGKIQRRRPVGVSMLMLMLDDGAFVIFRSV